MNKQMIDDVAKLIDPIIGNRSTKCLTASELPEKGTRYILINIIENCAYFAAEDPENPGYPKNMDSTGMIMLKFSGEWTRHQRAETTAQGVVVSPVNKRDFAVGRDGRSAVWLESKNRVHNITIHAGCYTGDFLDLIALGGGEIRWDDIWVRHRLVYGSPSPETQCCSTDRE